MHSFNAPIATSFSLSIFLHGAAFAALLLVYGQVTTSGEGVEIELVRSTMISDQQETDVPRNRVTQIDNSDALAEQKPMIKQQEQLASRQLLTAHDNTSMVPAQENADRATPLERQLAQWPLASNRQQQKVVDTGESSSVLRQSTNAAQQQLSILALLHDSISNNKEYPYLARRQRREGVATVGFILHPDGSIEDAHLVASSSADTLDRAALSAVKRIAPFRPAHDYLDHAEAFKIDVVFNLSQE
jgi:TonB family protein